MQASDKDDRLEKRGQAMGDGRRGAGLTPIRAGG
jgi:hypothetical protein